MLRLLAAIIYFQVVLIFGGISVSMFLKYSSNKKRPVGMGVWVWFIKLFLYKNCMGIVYLVTRILSRTLI